MHNIPRHCLGAHVVRQPIDRAGRLERPPVAVRRLRRGLTRIDEQRIGGNHELQSPQTTLDRLDAPYLPLVAMQAAGIPLDACFSEQRAILQWCGGLFYSREGGGQASRLNRLLIDTGLIKGLWIVRTASFEADCFGSPGVCRLKRATGRSAPRRLRTTKRSNLNSE
jgi:hypothetical protein